MLVDAPPTALTGAVPLLRLARLAPSCRRPLILLHEGMEPQGTIASRLALALLQGPLPPEAPLVVAADASLAIAIGALRATGGGPVTAVLSAELSHESRALLLAWGVTLVRTEASLGRSGALAKARELAAHKPGALLVDPEALEPAACASAALALVAELRASLAAARCTVLLPAVGGSFTRALLHALRSGFAGAQVAVVVARPEDAPDPVTGGASAVQGLLLASELGEHDSVSIFAADSASSWRTVREAARREGLLVGPGTGAVLTAAVRVASGEGEEHTVPVVAIGVDTGERYFSLQRFHHEAP